MEEFYHITSICLFFWLWNNSFNVVGRRPTVRARISKITNLRFFSFIKYFMWVVYGGNVAQMCPVNIEWLCYRYSAVSLKLHLFGWQKKKKKALYFCPNISIIFFIISRSESKKYCFLWIFTWNHWMPCTNPPPLIWIWAL